MKEWCLRLGGSLRGQKGATSGPSSANRAQHGDPSTGPSSPGRCATLKARITVRTLGAIVSACIAGGCTHPAQNGANLPDEGRSASVGLTGDDSTAPISSPSSVMHNPRPPSPDRVDGTKEILALTDEEGSKIVGTLDSRSGNLWLAMTCQGSGALTLIFEPLGRFEVPCTRDGLPKTLNEIVLEKPRTLKLNVVDGLGQNRWSLSVQQ